MKKTAIKILTVLFVFAALSAALALFSACGNKNNGNTDEYGYQRPKNAWMTESVILNSDNFYKYLKSVDSPDKKNIFGNGGKSGLMNDEIAALDCVDIDSYYVYLVLLVYGHKDTSLNGTVVNYSFTENAADGITIAGVNNNSISVSCPDYSIDKYKPSNSLTIPDDDNNVIQTFQTCFVFEFSMKEYTDAFIEAVAEPQDAQSDFATYYAAEAHHVTVSEEYSDKPVTVGVENLNLKYFTEEECPDGDITKATPKDNLTYTVRSLYRNGVAVDSSAYFAVIEFDIQTLKGSDGNDNLHAIVVVPERFSAIFQDVPTSNSSTKTENGITYLDAVFTVSPDVGTNKSIRIIVKLTPERSSLSGDDFSFDFYLLSETVSVSGYSFRHSLVDAKVDPVKYELSDDGSFYTVTGLANFSAQITIEDEYLEFPISTYKGKTLPVRQIEAEAFEGTHIWNVIIGNNIEVIGKNAFSGCTSLESVTIGNGVTSIGTYAFYNCTALTEINYNATECEDLSSGGTFSYAGQNGNGITVTIGANVKKIPTYLFCNDSSTSPKIVSVVFAENSQCESIGNYAFAYCTKLTGITIPDGVTAIGYGAFSGCASLENITVDESNTAYTSQDGILYDKDKTEIVYVPKNIQGSITIPDGVTSIGYGAFMGCIALESIEIPDGVVTIGDSAFDGCTTLQSVTIGSGVTDIGVCAFQDCTSLESVTIGSGVKSIGNYAFYNCTSLESIKIPDGVTGIGYHAFYNCASLESVTIGSGVTSIDGWAFYGCASLTGVYITDIASWCNISFKDDSLNGYKGYCANPLYYAHNLYLNDELVTEITIPDGVTGIGQYAFYNCSALTSITIPDGVTSIGSYAFEGCSSIERATMSASAIKYIPQTSLQSVVITSGAIGEGAFYNGSSLTSVTIGSGVTSIGEKAFYYHPALTEINYNATECANLSSSNYVFYQAGRSGGGITVNIGANVKKIPAYLFYPYGLNSISYPKIGNVVFAENSVCESIGSSAFRYCITLTSITIPDSVTSIGSSAFEDCTALTEINYNATECADLSDKNNAFYNAGQSGEGITVNIGANVKKIPAYLFYLQYGSLSSYYPNIVSVVFKEGGVCTSIGADAFYKCKSLKSINIPDSVTDIGQYAFSGCSSLESVTIGDGVTSIGYEAFENCTSLKSITIPDSVTSIEYRAFYGCTSLESVTFKNTNGWWYANGSDATSGTSIPSDDLADASTAAYYLTSKSDYEGYWKRS